MKETVKKRKIECVWHFTRLSNLDNIFEHGLVSREEIDSGNIESEINDELRIDGQEKAICCSIGHPNYKMFYKLRHDNPDVKWVILVLKRSILWKKDCAFCISNAASSEVTVIDIEERKGLAAFNMLFDDIEGVPSRKDLDLPDFYPTNPQAEILVFERIEPKYIVGAITQDKTTEIALQKKYPTYDFSYLEEFFMPRKDYKHW